MSRPSTSLSTHFEIMASTNTQYVKTYRFSYHIVLNLFLMRSKLNTKKKIGVIHGPNTAPKADITIFSTTFTYILEIINKEK